MNKLDLNEFSIEYFQNALTKKSNSYTKLRYYFEEDEKEPIDLKFYEVFNNILFDIIKKKLD